MRFTWAIPALLALLLAPAAVAQVQQGPPLTRGAIVVNAKDFGASGSHQTTTGSISVSSTALTLASALDFAPPGSLAGAKTGIAILGAGAAFTASAPTGLSVVATGTTGATTYAYRIASCGDAQGYGAAIAAITIADGNAALGTATAGVLNYNALTWTNGSGASGVCIWRSKNAGAYAWVARTVGTAFTDSYPDAYLYAPTLWPTTPPASGRASTLVSSIVSGYGTAAVTLADAAGTTVTTSPVLHEDTAAIQAALNTCAAQTSPAGSEVMLPYGQYLVSSLTVTSACTVRGAGPASTYLWTYRDSDTFASTAAGIQELADLAIRPWDWSTKAAGWCGKFTNVNSVRLTNVRCGGFNGFWNDNSTFFNTSEVFFDQIVGDYGFRLRGTSGSPAAILSNIGSTTQSLSNTTVRWINTDSFMDGVTVTKSNFAGGGYCYYQEDTGASSPSFAWLDIGCDAPWKDGIALTAGINTIVPSTAYISSSKTGHGLRTSGTFLGQLTIANGATIIGNALRGVSIEAGTHNVIGGAVTANSASSANGYSEVYVGANLNYQTIPHGAVFNRGGAGPLTTDKYCFEVAAGTGNYISFQGNVSGGCSTGNISFGATGANNTVVDSASGGVALVGGQTFSTGLFAPGNNTPSTLFRGYSFSTSYPYSVQSIYDGSGISHYNLFSTVLGSTATRAAPTATGDTAGFGVGWDQSRAKFRMFSTPAGTNQTPAYLLDVGLGLIGFGDAAGVPTHISTAQATAPALTSCGTGSPAIVGTDTAGTVTMGTTATSCVITFNAAYVAAPHCTVIWQATALLSQFYTVSNTAITLTQTATSGNLVNYMCMGRSGG